MRRVVAWVFDNKGERNIWVADAPDFVPRQVTHYKGDDGQAIASVKLTPDGKTIVYARGSEIEQGRYLGKSAKPDEDAEAAGMGDKRERRRTAVAR